jgi:hypothetical protein
MRHDATPGTGGEDAPAILSLERLVATTLERELEAAKAREATLLEREAELLALVHTQQETHQRLLEQGRPPQGFWTRMVAPWRRAPSSGTTQP